MIPNKAKYRGEKNLNKDIHRQETKGSITVFLTLILLLILSLLFTIIEGARVGTAKVYAERGLTTAMDSVLAEYYGPLWEEYHIFGLNTGESSNKEQKEQITTKLSEYMSYTFSPNQNQKPYKDCLELYDISLDSISVKDETMLMDYQGELLINEAVEYMKYNEIGSGIELLLEKLTLLETPKKVSVIYEEKEKVEEELVEIDEGILELMELLDGLKTGKKGIELNNDGTLKTAEFYVKKICFEEVSKEAVGINQDDIFLALKDSYINPTVEFDSISSSITNIKLVLQRLAEIPIEEENINLTIGGLQTQLSQVNSADEENIEVLRQIEAISDSINGLQVYKEALQREKTDLERKKVQLVSAIHASKNRLSKIIKEILPLINDSIATIDNIIQKSEKAEPLIKEYEESLYKVKDSIGDDIYAGLEEGLNELKRYTARDNSGFDFTGMKSILVSNRSVLEQVEVILNQASSELSQEMYQSSNATFNNAKNTFKAYQIRGLTLDYSTLVFDKQKDPLSEVNTLLQTGITSLIMDPNTISKSEFTIEQLPSVIAAMSKEDQDFLSGLTSYFENTAIGGKSSGMSNVFSSFIDGNQILSMAGNGINKVSEHFLYQEYLKEHFGMYPKENEDLKARKPSVLIYEQEYLLVGKMSDQENLSSVVSRILFLRTILDFVSILGDKAKVNEAKLVAASLVGFTGLPILVGITQTLILLIWSFAEALVDTCALMMGKEVPIIKKQVVMDFADLFVINRRLLQFKASKIVESKRLSFSYYDYVRVFLLLKNKEDLVYRSMDLIQENINIRYVDSFLIENCLFGYQVEADYMIKSKFTAFSFVNKYIGGSVSGFPFSTEAAYSY